MLELVPGVRKSQRIEIGNVSMCLPINDEYANTNKDQCAAVLNFAAVYYVEDKFDFAAAKVMVLMYCQLCLKKPGS